MLVLASRVVGEFPRRPREPFQFSLDAGLGAAPGTHLLFGPEGEKLANVGQEIIFRVIH
jgi:hypothetical protein